MPMQLNCIDDDAICHQIVHMMVKHVDLDIVVTDFNQGQEALLALQTQLTAAAPVWPDVMLLDIEMPVMNGWAFLDAFRLLRPSLPQMQVIVTSSALATTYAPKSLAMGADLFIPKPIGVEVFTSLFQAKSRV